MALVLVIGLLAGVGYFKSHDVIAWLVVNGPHLLQKRVEQKIGFAQTSDGVRIAYATSGAGLPLVLTNGFATHLVEGLGSPLYDEGGWIRWHSRKHLVVRYDGRGFGLSDRSVDDFSLDARLADLEAVVDALGLERFALYGYSAGGVIAAGFAARYPDRVSHLILTATYAAAADTADPQGVFLLADYIRENWANPLARVALAEGLAPGASPVERRVILHLLQVAGDGPQVADFMRQHWQTDVSAVASHIRVPTLIVAGDADPVVPLGASRRLAAMIPGARFEVLDGGVSHFEAAASDPRLLRIIDDFIESGG